jgi:hypothetical protein
MLFDIRGRRKRVVQVIYGGLALLIGLGAILFGIGGSANGGLADLLGFGDSSSTDSADSQAQAQIERAEETLKSSPNDEKALLLLVKGHFAAGTAALGTDEAGNRVPTEETISQFTDATDAWGKYLAADPAKPDANTASIVRQAYPYVFSTTPIDEARPVIDDAFATAKIVAADQPGALSYLELASYAYLAGDTKAAEEAKKKALAEAPDDSTKDQRRRLPRRPRRSSRIRSAASAAAPACRARRRHLAASAAPLALAPPGH